MCAFVKTCVKTSAPASLMLFGEHAVLQKKHALVTALDVRLSVILQPRSDDTITITSSLGSYQTSRFKIEEKPPFTFVTDCIRSIQGSLQGSWQEQIPSGFDLEIVSEISPLFGLGSSSAVTVATYAALLTWLQKGFTKELLFQKALKTIRNVQNLGSGADVAASVFGGVVLYKTDPYTIEPMPALFDLSVFYSKSKMPTPQVVQKVLDAQKKHPAIFKTLFEAMDTIVLDAASCITCGNIEKLGELCTLHQGLQDALGVNTLELSEIIYTLRKDPNIFGTKISGSGLGDCVIGFGKTTTLIKDYPKLNVQMSNKGVEVELG